MIKLQQQQIKHGISHDLAHQSLLQNVIFANCFVFGLKTFHCNIFAFILILIHLIFRSLILTAQRVVKSLEKQISFPNYCLF